MNAKNWPVKLFTQAHGETPSLLKLKEEMFTFYREPLESAD
jgi:hypothetical protein